MTAATSHEVLPGQRIYFASDMHLGAPTEADSLLREKSLIRWLERVHHDAAVIYLVGDVFDFWFEYRNVIPKGFIRFQGKLAELRDKGVRLELFTGNHDMWLFDYFTDTLGIPVHRAPIRRTYFGKELLIGHGDGLGPGDHSYKVLKRIFANKACQWAFRWLHPDVGMWIAHQWSRRSRLHNIARNEDVFLGDREYLLAYCKEYLRQLHMDYFVFGHRHLPLDIDLGQGSRYLNLGEWLRFRSYAVMDENGMQLCYWEPSA
jgi:UDP-2,3-diacylglucosamine hydrolase